MESKPNTAPPLLPSLAFQPSKVCATEVAPSCLTKPQAIWSAKTVPYRPACNYFLSESSMCSSESTVTLLEMIFQSVPSSPPARPASFPQLTQLQCGCPSLTVRQTDPTALLLYFCLHFTVTEEERHCAIYLFCLLSIFDCYSLETIWQCKSSCAWSPHCRSTWERSICERPNGG